MSLTHKPYYQQAVNYSSILELIGFKYAWFWRIQSKIEHLYEDEIPLLDRIEQLVQIIGCTEDRVRKIYESVYESFELVDLDYSIVGKHDHSYPALLKEIQNPPPFLFVQGNMSLFENQCVSVVGTRKPTDNGRIRALKLAILLKDQGVVVVSGLANGIDTAAHLGAIKSGGKTVAVIGTPLNHYYPKENRLLQQLIAENHLLVSQFPFNHPVQRWNFPHRNNTMSGLSQATVIVEASETSGALIQAKQCLKQGRRLFMLRNLLENPELRWPAQYIDKGAVALGEISDITRQLDRYVDKAEIKVEAIEETSENQCKMIFE